MTMRYRKPGTIDKPTAARPLSLRNTRRPIMGLPPFFKTRKVRLKPDATEGVTFSETAVIPASRPQ